MLSGKERLDQSVGDAFGAQRKDVFRPSSSVYIPHAFSIWLSVGQ